ncbi:uncharacterized protein EHS24_007222 [Apiotrichum porosum]|uniref:Uncharacterized protein n=1 Tax=Apiotrichum porosum TaxID=105984 RepID=A0A427XXS9_9TREE|nr:uncharacterized protein EHS24_007222 [Apiotrichum porosum]RSH83535.1 hypothetical protein EHS24_007222 [Apiotrichum porosum]
MLSSRFHYQHAGTLDRVERTLDSSNSWKPVEKNPVVAGPEKLAEGMVACLQYTGKPVAKHDRPVAAKKLSPAVGVKATRHWPGSNP